MRERILNGEGCIFKGVLVLLFQGNVGRAVCEVLPSSHSQIRVSWPMVFPQ